MNVDEDALSTPQVAGDASSAVDDANGDAGSKRRRGRRGGRRRRRGTGEAGGIAGEDGQIDQDGAQDEGLNADGSQPEFDFDDIEATQPKAVAPASAATAPVIQVEEAKVAEVQTPAVASPSPAVEAAQAVAMAVEASDTTDVRVVEASATDNVEAVAQPDVRFADVEAEPVAAGAPIAASITKAPDRDPVTPPNATVAAAIPTAVPGFVPSSEAVAWIEEPIVAPVVATPEPAVAAVEADASEATVSAVEPAVAASVETDASSRAEQLRGLFDTARVSPQAAETAADTEANVDTTTRTG